MLNQAFPKSMKTKANDDYILDKKIQDIIIQQNVSTNTGLERRLDPFYTYEIQTKLNDLGLTLDIFKDKIIMDICSGAGFLTYHLLKAGIKPKKIVLCDISDKEIVQSKKLLRTLHIKDIQIDYINTNILENTLQSDSFDIIIGHSYLHHFYDIPQFIQAICRLLKRNGLFISTHEPSYGALAVESGSFGLYLYYLFRGKKYIDDFRFRGETIKPNNLGDVWIFENNKLERIFKNNGFKDVRIKNGGIFRSLLITNFGLSPLLKFNISSTLKSKLSKIGLNIDNTLKKILPKSFFGDLIFVCEKK